MIKGLRLKFSIIISTFNRSYALKKAIESVLSQSYQNFEIIISDDASADNTKELVASFNDNKITYICNIKNSGLSMTRNAALKIVKGEYIILMDDDSMLENNFLEVLGRLIEQKKANIFCPKILDPDTRKPFLDIFSNQKEKYLGYFDFNYFIGLAHIVSKRMVDECGFYDDKFGVGARFFAAEESDYFFRLKKIGERILYSPDLTVYHRRQDEVPELKAYRYSYGIAAMLTKQIICDKRHFLFYLWLLSKRLTISFLRTVQYAVIPKTIESKNRMYRYKQFFYGSLTGAVDYLKEGCILK
ncbi:MAG: glycosyltransferase [Candidatus Omnitrophica bacterium]|nr:glycosyltransferase [Candidatus Omnitrophota bacterium]